MNEHIQSYSSSHIVKDSFMPKIPNIFLYPFIVLRLWVDKAQLRVCSQNNTILTFLADTESSSTVVSGFVKKNNGARKLGNLNT